MQNLDFNNIRTLGSLNDGFEEMVCQMAHRMSVPFGKKFVRNGRPDGGVECYWELENGDIWMWQAKYFVSVPGASQFEQISDSVKTALRYHKNVKRYYIAVPQDLPDDGKTTTKSARKRFDEKVVQWNKVKGAEDTEFIYWGKHELLDILSKKENEGLAYFWFHKNEFTEKDFEEQNEKAISALGSRYTPELNIELDIAKVFDGLSRNHRFEERLKGKLTKFKNAWQRVKIPMTERKSETVLELSQSVNDAIEEGKNIVFGGIEQLPFSSLKAKIESVGNSAQVIIEYFEKKQSESKGDKIVNKEIESYNYVIRDLRDFYYESCRLSDYLGDTECKAANNPFLLVDGEAGVGKSHLLADVVESRRKDGRCSLLFLGQHFNASDDPWTQIFKQIKFKGTETEFLQALEAKAESTGHRVIIFIDALNEGGGKVLWNNYISSFIQQIRRYKWLGLVLSIRTTYNKAIFEDKETKDILRITHRGFESRSFDAIKVFFKNSKIALPTVPLLLPEFKNPLFLKFFCDGLHRNGLTRIDDGMQGISSIINLFIEGVEKDLSSPRKRDYMPELHIVRKAVNALIDYQVENLTNEVPLDKAIELTNSIKTDKFKDGELLYELVSYGVLTRNLKYIAVNKYEEVVYLSYERFNDFLIAQRMLEKTDSVEAAVNNLVRDKHNLWYYAGIIESLAIIIPEKEGREIYEVIPDVQDDNINIIADSVLKSLLWRKKSTIGEKLVDYFNKEMDSQFFVDFLSTLIQVAPIAGHYFNAEFLHRNLMKWTMAERDKRWSINLRPISSERDNPVDTLITWAKEDYRQEAIDANAKFLTGVVLLWFTTCMDRRIRDNATKGVIALVRNDVGLMIKLIDKFEGVNDPYVVERIYAAAYGCALLSDNFEKLPDLAKCVYNHLFNVEGEVYPNALVRDYAKGVIEYTLTKFPELKLGEKPYIPPFKTAFPKSFPSDEEIKAYSKDDEKGKSITPGIDGILSSMVTEHGYTIYGDFGRYVFQSHLSCWELDSQKLSNLAVKWIMEQYGYKEEFFGEYDSNVGYGRMRQVYPGERVGKKYQWIAFHEMVARVSDNYQMRDTWNNQEIKYNGTWEPYIRDFDPSMLVSKRIPNWFEKETKYWWNRQEYSEWNGELSSWIRTYDNLPKPEKVIETVDNDGVHWLALQAMPDWTEPHEEGENIYRNLWYQIRSYIVDEEKFGDFALWALDQNFSGRWMPESSDRYEMFSREYYWSSVYQYYDKEGITAREISDNKNKRKIADVELSCINFLWESEYDYSKPDTVSYLKPSKSLFEGLDMRYSEVDGELLDENGNILCFDTSTNHNSHSNLLVRKDALMEYLKTNHKRILWAVIGEKNILGHAVPNYEWLELSGAYYLDSQDEIKGTLSPYLKGKPLQKPESNKLKIDILDKYQSKNNEMVYFDKEQRIYSVQDIKAMLSSGGKLVLDAPMSNDIWNVDRRSKYIESILADMPLTAITVVREKDGRLKVLDGGQRIRAIYDYVSGKYSLRNLNMMILFEDCKYDELTSKGRSRLIYSEIPFIVLTSPISEKERAELYNRLNVGIHQISEKDRRLLQFKGKMTDVMDLLLKDKHFVQLTRNSHKVENSISKEDIALRLIVDYVVTQGNDSYVRYLNEGYQQQLSDAAKFLNNRVSDEYIAEMQDGIRETLKEIESSLGNDITKKINDVFSLPLFEILFMAFLFNNKQNGKEVLKDIVNKFIEENTFKISRAGNDSSVKTRERLMLAIELNKILSI